MGVSRGSFYWHFADIGAFHAAILKHWSEVATEQVIAGLEATPKDRRRARGAVARRIFASDRRWRMRSAPGPRSMPARGRPCRPSTQAIGYIEVLLKQAGLSADTARARAQILYWAFLGYALSEQPLPKARQQGMVEELLRMATR